MCTTFWEEARTHARSAPGKCQYTTACALPSPPQKACISREEARRRIFMVDSKGLITTSRGDKLPEHKQRFARDDGTPDMKVGAAACCTPACCTSATAAGDCR